MSIYVIFTVNYKMARSFSVKLHRLSSSVDSKGILLLIKLAGFYCSIFAVFCHYNHSFYSVLHCIPVFAQGLNLFDIFYRTVRERKNHPIYT